MELTPISERFILHWGEMGTRWGVNRTVAQIHALLAARRSASASYGRHGCPSPGRRPEYAATALLALRAAVGVARIPGLRLDDCRVLPDGDQAHTGGAMNSTAKIIPALAVRIKQQMEEQR